MWWSITEVEISSRADAVLGIGKVRGVTMYVEYHSTVLIPYACIIMRCKVVDELNGFLGCGYSDFGSR